MKQPRTGKTLLEALVIISILSIVIGMSTTSLATLFRLHRQFRRDGEQAAILSRLASRLRADAHEAVSASLDDGCKLTLSDGRTIHYVYAMPRMIREVRRDDAVLHHDTFLLPRSAAVTFEQDGSLPSSLIRLSIRPTETRLPPRDLPRRATIEASVGVSRALARTGRQP